MEGEGVMENFHVLLIGIDAYAAPNALHGCVNDIDKIEELLVGSRVSIAKERIRRLASPHGARKEGELPATLENMRAAFKELAERAAAGDRIFIYYSGHGFRHVVDTPQGAFHREALVPVDTGKLLYDYELNGLLADIVAKTSSVTLVLDCCHSAGATRGPDAGLTARAFDSKGITLDDDVGPPTPGGIGRDVDQCHVVCACLDHESAYESTAGTERNGLLTRALVAALDGLDVPDLRKVSWAHIWQHVRARVVGENAAQHVSMTGNAGRMVFAGPPVEGDAGIPITPNEGGTYTVHAGTLAGIGIGARLAVYDHTPAFFAALGTPEDRPLGRLSVTRAERATATATAMQPFTLPAAARARLVTPPVAERLRCFVDDPALAAAVTSSMLDIVTRDNAQVRLEKLGTGWALTDDVHALAPPLWPLFWFAADANDPNAVDDVRAVLEHYARYVLPIQLANRSTDLPKQLELSVRVCPGTLAAADAQVMQLREAETTNDHEYRLRPGACITLQVLNKSNVKLRVTLVNAAASGRVELLGDHVIDARSTHRFWMRGVIGEPFVANLPGNATAGTERLVAIGRTGVEHDLSFLRSDRRFSDTLVRGGMRDFGDPAEGAQLLHLWTASQALVRTCA
jgi:Caspase domain